MHVTRDSCSWPALLCARECGRRGGAVSGRAHAVRLRSIELSAHVELAPVHSETVTALSLDPVEGRYLLSAAADATMALYDAEDTPACTETPLEPRPPIGTVSRGSAAAHRYAVSSLQWFPHDTGLFVSGGFDSLVKLWDTNTLFAACDFSLPGRVHCVAMSSVATTHTLIAACCENSSSVYLCDPATGSAAHQLSGHRNPAWTLCWSPRHEHQLVSGGADRSVRIWDIRRAGGCLRALDQHDSAGERRRLAACAPARAQQGATTVAGAARQLATPTAHGGAVTSAAFAADGLLLLTAGRDHRMRLWDADTGAHMLVHYADCFNTARGSRQMGVSAGGGAAGGLRAYFPAAEGVVVYELLSGRKLQTLRAHLGEVTCCVSSPWDARLFSGGDDHTVHSWTPPPCGLSKPAPAEQPAEPVDCSGGGGGFYFGGGGGGGGLSDVAAGAPAPAQQAQEDADAWSDAEEDAPPRRAPRKRRREGAG